ncbi:hypothetical protein KVV02_002791 [Mortierella alpina]|uniref:Uncharacterized protein n=1 Tax=Mortierella alpina TaxID=64518 RepID=A0A9P8A893_MORAP|nr:hypothetical protein KVV02_002791 [Mortierella alpina]
MGRRPESATGDQRRGLALASASRLEDHLALRAAVDGLQSPKKASNSPSNSPSSSPSSSSSPSTHPSKRLGARGIGGNQRQSSLDTWMSHVAHGKENRRAQSAPNQPRSSPCRSTPRRPRSDYEPLNLVSVQTAPQTPQRNPTPRRATPRKTRASNENEVSCSEDEPLETVVSQISQTSRGPPQTHVISSDDTEVDDGHLRISPRIRRHRRSVREVIQSSDEDGCDDTVHPYPVAEDLVPQCDRTPWSTVSGPERDIVLATPKRERVRHYAVLDSDHELSDEEKSLPMFTPHRAHVASRHLSLPVLDSEGEESGRALTKPRPLVLEHLSDDNSGEESTMGPTSMTAKSTPPISMTTTSIPPSSTAATSIPPTSMTAKSTPSTSMAATSIPTTSMTAKSVPVESTRQRPIPKLRAVSREALASPSAAQLRKRDFISEQLEQGIDPFAEFERILHPQKRKAQAPVPDKSEIVDITGDDKPSERPSKPSPPKLRKLTDVAPKPSDLAEALRVASFCSRRAALNGTANPTHIPVFKKASSLEPINPGARPPPRLRRVSEHAPEVVPPPQRTETLESISSFSTASGSQQEVTRMDLTSDREMLPVDEIEYFSDDPRTQTTTNTSRTNESLQVKRQAKRYSPLRLMNNSRPGTPSVAMEHCQEVQAQARTEKNQERAEKKDPAQAVEPQPQTKHCNPQPLSDTSRPVTPSKTMEHGQGMKRKEVRAVTNQVCSEKELAQHEPKKQEPKPSLDMQAGQPRAHRSPTQPLASFQNCPLCDKMIPAADLTAHVNEELRVKDQEAKDARQKQDEAFAMALTETYQTQDAMFNLSSQRAPQTQDPPQGQRATKVQTATRQEDQVETTNPFMTPMKPKSARDLVSMDTPMRKIGEMALSSPIPGSEPSRDVISKDTPMRQEDQVEPINPFMTPMRPKSARDIVSMDTPMRKIGEMALRSPMPGSESSRDAVSTDSPLRKAGEKTLKSPLSGLHSDEEEMHRNLSNSDPSALVEGGMSLTESKKLSSQSLDHEPAHIDEPAPLFDPARFLEADSLSSQNPLRIQCGQVIESTPPEQYISMESSEHNNSPLFLDPFSLSSQNPLRIPCGQVIESTPPEPYFSMRPNARSKSTGTERSRERNNNPTTMEQASPQALIISDDSLDDLEDFLDLPEPASMLNRSFRTKAMASKEGNAAPKKNKSPKKAPSRARKDTGRKGTIALDDSEDDGCIGEETNVTKAAKGTSTTKPCILDRMLPLSARRRRQSILNRRAARKSERNSERNSGSEADIEIGRHLTEKLWNANDDLFDSEGLDRRQVKGVGLGGVVGGIGAVSGSLAVSNITKSAMGATRTKEGSEMSLRQNWSADDEPMDDALAFSQPSYELEDPNYGLPSQDWWSEAQPNIDGGHNEHIEARADGLDAGRLSPLEDFVDLRKRRDDPTVAMYFAQLDAMGAGGSDEGSGSKSTRGRKRGGARGRGGRRGGRGVSYAAGVGPISTTSSSTGRSAERDASSTGPSMTQSTLPFGGQATTANGSMAIRSKPTPAFTPGGSSRGRGGKWRWRGNAWRRGKK